MPLNKANIEVINNFIQGFATVTSKVLSQNLDKEVYKKINFSDIESSEIANLDDLKENNVLYKLSYVKGPKESTLGILVPEELLASITDVIMGGSGENAYKDSISELEMNSSADLFKKIFKDIELFFKKRYNSDLAFDAKHQFLLKNTDEYDNSFDDSVFNLVVKLNLVINDTQKFGIKLLLNLKDVKRILTDLRLLQGNEAARNTDLDTINMSRLSDVKIEITAELGEARVPIKYALELVRGSIIELDTLNNADIKVFANGIEVAMAQVVAIEDNFGLRITKIISPEERMKYI